MSFSSPVSNIFISIALIALPGEGPVRYVDLEGRSQTPLAFEKKKAAVLLFLMPDCPVSNAYGPEIQRICKSYEAKSIAIYVIHADPDVTVEQAKKHAKEFGYSCPVLLDPKHVLVNAAGVKMAPEAAVFGANGKVLYRGRIDDLYVDYGKRRPAPTQHDLCDALDAILEGKEVKMPSTKVIGCYLPDPRK
jgi:hypothetical protein